MNHFRELSFAPTTSIVQPVYSEPFFQQRCYFGVAQPWEADTARREIEELATLDGNWDGYGALKIQEQTRKNALAAVDLMLYWAPAPDIAPNSNGTISMEWETDSGIGHFEIGQTRYSFYIDREGGDPILADGRADEVAPQLGLVISSVLYPLKPGAAASTLIEGNVQPSDRHRGL
jgi:hypothetical protein